ncbi:MAG: hypothetical protein QNJ46_33895 [Leptolyngbyaceae cyanobacterium MO_188.B28]|nr:hypothetical protein [Leptolyngbyaceae cyanobacterium MO_188.B28]
MTALNPVIQFLIQSQQLDTEPLLSVELSKLEDQDANALRQNLNAAFLMLLVDPLRPEFSQAKTYLDNLTRSPKWGNWAKFYINAAQLIAAELEKCSQADPELKANFQRVETALAKTPIDRNEISESVWAALFPEGVGIRGHEEASISQLREKRTVTISQLNPDPIQDPAKQILFTSNVLLTTPLGSADLSVFDQDFQTQLSETAQEPQLYWYDHPIPIGVSAESNEILYGLKNFNQAVEVERQRHPGETAKVNCVLSVSVTHKRLQTLGKSYLKQVLAANDPLNQLNIFAFTEADTDALIQQVLLPILEKCAPTENAADLLSVFGVDGRYGRHYSFLKAIAALWNILIDPEIKATFKIDLDQVFPQPELIEQTGASAFEHFLTPLWGATGQDADGNPIELGMIAGALVNQRDIHKGVFTPDVTFPNGGLASDEYIFFSKLPQALSTEAEMMTRYQPGTPLDGSQTCLQRIHVTGGTNGVLVDSLRRFQPFTPSFIARAEDQAYILSTLGQSDRLGYAHASGLIMRHDKEGFAQEAIAMAKVGKQIGDYLRILMFSAYAKALPQSFNEIKHVADPFTGCFISRLPITVALLRFALKVSTLFSQGKAEEATEFMHTGIPQLEEGLDFTQGQSNSALQQVYDREKQGWTLFYRSLAEVEKALQAGEPWAISVQTAAKQIVSDCLVN